MSETVILWLFGTLVGLQTLVIGALAGAIWTHVRECRSFREQVAQMNADLKRVVLDIGTHESGLRGQIHALRNEILPLIVVSQMRKERDKAK